MIDPQDYPQIEELADLSEHPELDALAKALEVDFPSITNVDEYARRFPALSTKYAALLAKCDYEESVADATLKIIRSRIVLAFEDNPSAFLSSTRRRNMQISEAVYRTHPQYRAAMKRLILAIAKRRMVIQACYTVDQTRTMLSLLGGARASCSPEVMPGIETEITEQSKATE